MHTADWHLGKKLLGYDRLEEQTRFLDSLEGLVRDDAVDALLICGDIFDRSVPPVEALSLFGDFLERMAALRCRVIAIAGNHDSAERLGFAGGLLERSGVHLSTSVQQALRPILLSSRGVEVEVFALPFADPQSLTAELAQHTDASLDPDAFRHHGAAVEAYVRSLPQRGARARVLLAHVFCIGGQETPESERPISSGGASLVSPSIFAGFDYVALGHLHRPQRVGGREHIRYAGSPLQYSIAEHAHPKSVTVVDIEAGDESAYQVRPRALQLDSGRKIVVLKDRFEALLTDDRYEAHRNDFVAAYYVDESYVLNAAARLQERFPCLLQALSARVATAIEVPDARTRADSPRELLEGFWKYVRVEHELEEAHHALYERTLQKVGLSAARDDKPAAEPARQPEADA